MQKPRSKGGVSVFTWGYSCIVHNLLFRVEIQLNGARFVPVWLPVIKSFRCSRQ